MAIDLFTIGKFTVHGYGLMIGLGFMVATLIGCTRAKKLGLSDDHYVNISIFVLLCGFAGGKLMYCIVNFKAFLESPLAVLGSEGFVVYGGIIIGVLTILVYCLIKKISFFEYFDLLTPSVAINQAFGRIGCFLAGCCYGKQTDSWLGVVFPEHSIAPAGVKILPTQLFMSAGDFIIFLVLLWYAKRRKKPGMVAGVYLALYSVGRFLIEFLRDDPERGTVGALSTSQFVAIWIFAGAVIYMILLNKIVKSESAEQPDTEEESGNVES